MRKETALNLTLTGLLVALGAAHLAARALPPAQTLASLLVLFLMAAAYIGLADPRLVERMGSLLRPKWRLALLPQLFWFALFLSYAAVWGRLDPGDGVVLLAYLLVPLLLVRLDREGPAGLSWFLGAATLALWFPVEFGWLPALTLPPEGGLQVARLLGVISTLYLFLVVRGLQGVGYTYVLSQQDWKVACRHFALFLAFFGIPLAIPLEFVRSSPQMTGVLDWPVTALLVFFFTAVPEEILFRGVIQNLMARRFEKHPKTVLLVSSVIFGLAHANNRRPPLLTWTVPGWGLIELPWVYVVLATVAGLFYGLTYLRTGKVTAAAVVHALVDTWWVLFFKG